MSHRDIVCFFCCSWNYFLKLRGQFHTPVLDSIVLFPDLVKWGPEIGTSTHSVSDRFGWDPFLSHQGQSLCISWCFEGHNQLVTDVSKILLLQPVVITFVCTSLLWAHMTSYNCCLDGGSSDTVVVALFPDVCILSGEESRIHGRSKVKFTPESRKSAKCNHLFAWPL